MVISCKKDQEAIYLHYLGHSTDMEPDILTYSNKYPDHYDPLRVADFNSLRLSGKIDTSIGDLNIPSIASSETDISYLDNYSFFFEYHGEKIQCQKRKNGKYSYRRSKTESFILLDLYLAKIRSRL